MVRLVYWHYAKNNIDSVAKDYGYILNLVKPVEKKPVYTTVTDTIKPLEKKVDYKAIVNRKTSKDPTSIFKMFLSHTRISNTIKKIKNRDYVGATFAASDLIINIPNSINDAGDAIKFIDKKNKIYCV